MIEYDEEITRLWLNYVKEHINILEPAVAQAERNILKVREYLSGFGAELTPQELEEFTSFLKQSIEYIRLTDID